MQSGTVADIAAVVDNCSVALQEAEEMAGFRPTQVVIGIAGELVKGFTTTHAQERKRPDPPITDAELQKLIDSVQQAALREAERAITWETGLPHVDVRLVHAAVTGARIDGYAVTNPVGFQGRYVKIGIFNAFAPLVHLGALQTVASSSTSSCSRSWPSRTPSPASWAASRSSRPARSSSTSAAARPTWPSSGRAASRGPGCSPSAAGRSRSRWPTGSTCRSRGPRRSRSTTPAACRSTGAKTVAQIMADDVAVWSAGVELVIEELAGGDLLPGRIYLCGGGSRLPATRRCPARRAVLEAAAVRPAARGRVMAPEKVETIRDATKLLVDQQDVTPLGLAYQAIELASKEDPLDAALRRVLRAMKV